MLLTHIKPLVIDRSVTASQVLGARGILRIRYTWTVPPAPKLDRHGLRALAHAGLPFNSPLSAERAGKLVASLAIAPGRHVLDVGCGWGELLLEVLAAHKATTGTGVDTDRVALDRGRRMAAERGLQDRVEFVEADARILDDHAELVLCVGAAHVWGGATAALRALHERVEPGGLVLFGDGFWERPPGADARRLFGDLPVFDGLLSVARSAGFTVDSADRSTQAEWDAFEAAWRNGLEASNEPDALLVAAERKHDYEQGYRGILGFVWLILAPA